MFRASFAAWDMYSFSIPALILCWSLIEIAINNFSRGSLPAWASGDDGT
jgi:hypothetical protein